MEDLGSDENHHSWLAPTGPHQSYQDQDIRVAAEHLGTTSLPIFRLAVAHAPTTKACACNLGALLLDIAQIVIRRHIAENVSTLPLVF